MPTLAQEIVKQNSAGVYPTLNFKGFAVGNPATNIYSTIPATMETYWYLFDKLTFSCMNSVLIEGDINLCQSQPGITTANTARTT